MVKSSRKTIVTDEIKVMNVLEQHAKENIDKIAKSCGFSRQKVWRIIKDLETRKIIWGYAAVTDESAKNLKHFILCLKRTSAPYDDQIRKEITLNKLDDLLPKLIKIENIYFTHGICDWIITFYAPDLATAKKFVDNLLGQFGKYNKEISLIETLFPVRKQGLKNPQLKQLASYL